MAIWNTSKRLPKKDIIVQLIDGISLMNCPPHTLIFKQGEPGDCMYIIVSGACEVWHNPVSADGTEVGLHVDGSEHMGRRVGALPAGQCFGEHLIGDIMGERPDEPHMRWSSVLSLGATDSMGNLTSSLVLRVDGKGMCGCMRAVTVLGRGVPCLTCVSVAAYHTMLHKKIKHADHVLMRRARFIRRLHLFQGWPLQEVAFFSYYMREYEVPKGTELYLEGEVPRSVFFVLKGCVALSTDKVLNSESGKKVHTVVEHVRAPRWFGEEELVAAMYGDDIDSDIRPTAPEGSHGTTLHDGPDSYELAGRFYNANAVEDCHIARMPLSVFFNMKFSRLARSAYLSTDYLKSFILRRFEWHRVRMEHDPSGFDKDVSYFFIEEVQDEFIPQVLVDVPDDWGNLKRVAQRGDQDTLDPIRLADHDHHDDRHHPLRRSFSHQDATLDPADLATLRTAHASDGAGAGAGAGSGSGSGAASPIVAASITPPRSRAASTASAGGTPRSARSAELSGLTPRSQRGLMSPGANITGDDWNNPAAPKPDARALLQQKAFRAMMAIIRCVGVWW